MSPEQEQLQRMVQQAAGIVSASDKKVGITKAMELVGFSEEETRQMTLCQQVRRLAMKVPLLVAPLPVAAVNAVDDVSSLTTKSESNPCGDTSTPSVRRRLIESTPSTATQTSNKPSKKMRQTSKEAQ